MKHLITYFRSQKANELLQPKPISGDVLTSLTKTAAQNVTISSNSAVKLPTKSSSKIKPISIDIKDPEIEKDLTKLMHFTTNEEYHSLVHNYNKMVLQFPPNFQSRINFNVTSGEILSINTESDNTLSLFFNGKKFQSITHYFFMIIGNVF